MKPLFLAASIATALALPAAAVKADTTVTIGTVNNGDMIIMQKLADAFGKQNPDIKLAGWCWRRMSCASA